MHTERASLFFCSTIVISLLIDVLNPLKAKSEPYFAFREGYKCSTCHVNKTGGGKRNEFGSSFPQTDFAPLLQEASEKSLEFSVDLGESFSLGMDFMVIHETLFAVDGSINEGGFSSTVKVEPTAFLFLCLTADQYWLLQMEVVGCYVKRWLSVWTTKGNCLEKSAAWTGPSNWSISQPIRVVGLWMPTATGQYCYRV